MFRFKYVIAVLCLFIPFVEAFAATIIVDAAGAGDVLTIDEALVLAVDDDTILIRPGNYQGPLDVYTAVQFIADGPLGSVVVDGQDTDYLFKVYAPKSVVFDGLTITRGWAPGENGFGSGCFAFNGSNVEIRDCEFIANNVGWDCAGVTAAGVGTVVTITNTLFENNYAGHNAGACGALSGSTLNIDGCTFIGNTSPGISGAVATLGADLTLYNSLFWRNMGGSVGAVRVLSGTADIRWNTMHDNMGDAAVSIVTYSPSSFKKNVVTSNPVGTFGYVSEAVERSYNVIYMGGPASDTDEPAPLDYNEDPLYCDMVGGDFTVCANSIALLENNGFHLIGAFGMGCDHCGPVPNEDQSWSDLKNSFR